MVQETGQSQDSSLLPTWKYSMFGMFTPCHSPIPKSKKCTFFQCSLALFPKWWHQISQVVCLHILCNFLKSKLTGRKGIHLRNCNCFHSSSASSSLLIRLLIRPIFSTTPSHLPTFPLAGFLEVSIFLCNTQFIHKNNDRRSKTLANPLPKAQNHPEGPKAKEHGSSWIFYAKDKARKYRR